MNMIPEGQLSRDSKRWLQTKAAAKPPTVEDILKTEVMQLECKNITINLKENRKGKFLRIIEESNGHHNHIIVPASGLTEFARILSDMIAAANALPSKAGGQSDR
jgi:hypothetical protein